MTIELLVSYFQASCRY